MKRPINPRLDRRTLVVPGHGPVSTTKIFDEYEAFYTLLMKRVGDMAAQGKSLDEIQTELKMPEYRDWGNQKNLPANIIVAYASLKR